MTPKIPMTDEEIRMHKPVSPDFVDFRAGIRCAERVYQVADLYSRIEALERELDHNLDSINKQREHIKELEEAVASQLRVIEALKDSDDPTLTVIQQLDQKDQRIAELEAALDAAQSNANTLWMLLDDIDTADDIAKADDKLYRGLCQQYQRQRWTVMTGEEIDLFQQQLKDTNDVDDDQQFSACPTCGEDGGTSCGVPNCGLLTGEDQYHPTIEDSVYDTIVQWDLHGGKRSKRELTRRIVALYESKQRSIEHNAINNNLLNALKQLVSEYDHYTDHDIEFEISQGNQMIIPYKQARQVIAAAEKAIK